MDPVAGQNAAQGHRNVALIKSFEVTVAVLEESQKRQSHLSAEQKFVLSGRLRVFDCLHALRGDLRDSVSDQCADTVPRHGDLLVISVCLIVRRDLKHHQLAELVEHKGKLVNLIKLV